MKQAFIIYAPWVISTFSLMNLWLLGEERKIGWITSFLNTSLWICWIVASETWGFLPEGLCLIAMYIHNYLKWSKNEK